MVKLTKMELAVLLATEAAASVRLAADSDTGCAAINLWKHGMLESMGIAGDGFCEYRLTPAGRERIRQACGGGK